MWLRNGRKPVDAERFNEAFMMHASTSPLYAIIASNDVACGVPKLASRLQIADFSGHGPSFGPPQAGRIVPLAVARVGALAG